MPRKGNLRVVQLEWLGVEGSQHGGPALKSRMRGWAFGPHGPPHPSQERARLQGLSLQGHNCWGRAWHPVFL